MKSSLKKEIIRLLNKSEDKTLLWFNGQYFEIVKGERKLIPEATAKKLLSSPGTKLLTFRVDPKKFDFDTARWVGPEIEPLPAEFTDRKNIQNFSIPDKETMLALLELTKGVTQPVK